MKVTAMRPVEMTVTGIRITVPVRHEDECIPYDFPFRKGDVWSVVVDGDTGRIRDWPAGVSGKCYLKVVDEGVYQLLGPDDCFLTELHDYVPACIPQEYGDYIDFDIGPDGAVKGWKSKWTAGRIREEFFPNDD